ncbi:uncharacterized protein HD556DRAFT_1241039 [Suillus plorans]|uniref:Cobalamin-independent methionine synthase MetE N-terminal domain-containing protein n=1 Tax=Suillus plorans TaxID=116603 RepID=A0A9P7AKC9_9AGAM|nr:uncharacterized protein HD556DRAFT_1241039 [Suillus plorans]KAG1791201.1 hypothetical protein HD556DRAFT_1241039 [Suillus plorans]
MVLLSVLGFPRIGANREVKKAVEVNWTGNLSAEELIKAASDVKKSSWSSLKERGVDLIPRLASPSRSTVSIQCHP